MKERIFSVVYMFFLTLVFTSVVSLVKHVSAEKIRLNEEVKLQSVVLEALGITVPQGASRGEAVTALFGERVRRIEEEERTVYAGYDESGKEVVGYAFPAVGPGFWGPIEAMVGVDAEMAEITGLDFPRHSGTPGRGARMPEDWFRDQFRGLPLRKSDGDGDYFRLVPPGSAGGEGELDAITGATMTSKAIERFLNREIESFVAAAAAAGDRAGRE
jgi:Na+-transporting NADH:ubiquinone oxidoreductase subunit C